VGVAGKVLGRAVRILSPVASVATHHRLLRRALVCPVYHISRENTPSWWNQRYPIKSPKQLECELEALLQLGNPVSLNELLEWKNGRADRPQGWFLSFDDGYREMQDVIAPILKRKGIPATFFLCSSLVDNRRPFFEDVAGWIAWQFPRTTPTAQSAVLAVLDDAGFTLDQLLRSRVPQWELLNHVAEILEIDISHWLKTEQPYLTGAQVTSLLQDGFDVGAHSIDHPLFSEIAAEERATQCGMSVDTLAHQFPGVSRVFAFPYGEFGLSRKDLVNLNQSGEVAMCFGTRGIIRDEMEPFLIQRMLCEGHSSSFERHLKSELCIQLQRLSNQRGTVRRVD
jgi:peptidoglycan/xylan/chitin deacetylase (PgdA/CDA1 family)